MSDRHNYEIKYRIYMPYICDAEYQLIATSGILTIVAKSSIEAWDYAQVLVDRTSKMLGGEDWEVYSLYEYC